MDDMPPLPNNPEVRLTLLRMQDHVDRVEEHLEATDKALAKLKEDHEKEIAKIKDKHDADISKLEEERNNAMKWGIGVLGAAVVAMGGVIAKFVGEHLK